MNECKQAIATALTVSAILPEVFSFANLLAKICQTYGTEYTAMCLMEMGVKL